LQALALTVPAAEATSRASPREHLGLALAALAELDREINRGLSHRRLHRDAARELARAAVERWRGPAALAGRRIELRWRGPHAEVICDPAGVGQALDNLIANALEHGGGPIVLEGAVAGGRVRFAVSDSGGRGARERPARRPRRGYGLRVVERVASEHDGRFTLHRHPAGTRALLELPARR
jgi:nitrogen fixation/metabolism regulation signal transduction histidine kinase